MILIDTSIWVDHFRKSEPRVAALLAAGQVAIHPFVIGEFIMGNVPSVDRIISFMTCLPLIETVTATDFYAFATTNKIGGTGLGFVDAHLIAALTGRNEASIWTRDKRLAAEALRLKCNCYSE